MIETVVKEYSRFSLLLSEDLRWVYLCLGTGLKNSSNFVFHVLHAKCLNSHEVH